MSPHVVDSHRLWSLTLGRYLRNTIERLTQRRSHRVVALCRCRRHEGDLQSSDAPRYILKEKYDANMLRPSQDSNPRQRRRLRHPRAAGAHRLFLPPAVFHFLSACLFLSPVRPAELVVSSEAAAAAAAVMAVPEAACSA